ncbi:MAG: ral secretion pathway protein [Nitrospirae bacterium]|jgi:type II secretory pathway component PulL|nr:ral secretion pathway protein [Nitrospirota bacterium]
MSRICFVDIKEQEAGKYTFEVRGNSYEIKEQKEFPLSDSHDLPADAVSDNMETVYLSLPLSSLNFRVLDLPFSDKERVREVLPFELDGMILGGADGAIFDAVTVGKTENTYQVLAVYIEKNRLRDILAKLRVHGIDPVCITSLELKHALMEFSLSKLVPPVFISKEERIPLAIEEMKKPTVNLRRDEFSYTRDVEKTRKSLKVTAVFIIMILLILSADILFRIISSKQEIALLRNEIRKSYLEIFPGEKNIVNELHQLKSHVKELKGREGVFIGVKPLNVLSELAQIEREGARFNEVTIDRESMTLRGEARSLSTVQQLQEKLKKYFDEVAISDSRASVQGNMLFTITAKERKA